MKLADIVSRVTIDPRELTDYALDQDNPVGHHKALVFERRLGFTKSNYELLLRQIESNALAAKVEFINEEGETLALCTLSPDQFIVVWQARTRTWLPVSERVEALVAHLPEETGQEVLDFARFLQAQRQRQQAESSARLVTMGRGTSR